MINYVFSTLNRYFSRNLLFWFFVCLSGVLTIVGIFEGVELLRRTMGRPHVGFSIIMEMILLKLPTHLQTLLPFIIFFSTIMSFWRLNQTQEITAAKASGVSVWQLVTGACVLTTLLGLVHLILVNPLASAMASRCDFLENAVFRATKSALSISSGGLWLREAGPQDGSKTIIRTATFDLEKNEFHHVSFYEFDNEGQYKGRYDAPMAKIIDGAWDIESGTYWDEHDVAHPGNTFKRSTDISLDNIRNNYTKPETLSFWEIPSFINSLEATGLSSTRYLLYWHSQIAKLGQIIAMVLLAATFCLHPTRYRNSSRLIGIGVLSAFVIHFTNDIVYAFGIAEKLPVLLAVWISPLVTIMLSTAFLLHTEDT
ncbi:MAG: LptF/LptG family permease [Alphaproteobacteria bacterium]|nr:LptF/LptG family permease [Alphaproteobacteria bacterium]